MSLVEVNRFTWVLLDSIGKDSHSYGNTIEQPVQTI